MTGAVITGLGITAPNGLGKQQYWAAASAGTSGIGPVTRFDPARYPATLAGEIAGFRPEDLLPARLLPQTDRVTRLALVAAEWALADARVEPARLPEFEMGVITASTSGGFEFAQGELQQLWSRGSRYVSAYQSFAWFYAVNSGQISIRHGMKGPGGVVVSDQAGGLDALAQARRQIRKGTSLIVSGAMDATLCPWGWAALWTSGLVSAAGDPSQAYLPFDPRACGHVPGEGGAIVIMESAEHARRRGAHVYGEVAGYGATFDARPGSGREPALRKAIELALADARTTPAEVDVVFADAAGTPAQDRIEAAAITAVFGPRAVPVTAPKTMTGRLYSGAGPLDTATALLAMAEGVIPPTVNVEPGPDHPLDLVVGTARPASLTTALVVARGYGGFNAAVVLRKPREEVAA
ncbi:act minimal PKS chain-length factor (CLF/KS beta) [Amycolatopsis pretoriensis]|uniref:Act minimal PKS chain-length factor (CLF/KS beta) n=1 Tax=Amycolatopsis pretoriensis TaxID=218821 RepID=A0A1H5QK49_9PSEU|nr:ketosynthase chain-length factor [Amycolatopsis pretoriensis]SEF26542.1 act minimal PKS chain-length factor (CLF/KS beta) [Amycolatopsis pretoriensis]